MPTRGRPRVSELSAELYRRVYANMTKADDFSRQTHDVDDTVDAALTWNRPDLGTDRA
jgi:hypothetical protein